MKPELTLHQRNLLELLGEEFSAKKRQGECPEIEAYATEYPELADEIRELFPVMEMLDQAIQKPDLQSPTGEISEGARLGEYQIIRPLGRGGMGVVYQAEHIVLGSSVAIKILPAGIDRPKLRERFQREASAAARMHHPNIVRVFDFGSHGETLYYVMSLVQGWGLNRIIGQPGNRPPAKAPNTDFPGTTHGNGSPPSNITQKVAAPTRQLSKNGIQLHSNNGDDFQLSQNLPGFDTKVQWDADTEHSPSFDRTKTSSSGSRQDSLWNWVARIGVQAADALDYAHSMGVIHRDIKPSNLMIDAEETIYVMDFGLAKITTDNSLTATGDILGTLRYMPPESFVGRADHRSDIYSLGLTLYELLNNKPAFDDVDRGKLIPAITNGQITRLNKTIPQIPRDLETVINKSIATDPADRYQSAAEFRDDLKAFLTGQPVMARRMTRLYQVSRWIGRNKVVSALAAMIFCLLTVTAVVSAISANRFENLATEKETQRVAATDAESDAKNQTRVAQMNLLAAKLSDASGWSMSQRPGHRVEGMRAVREAIGLARELNVFAQFEDQIKTTAVTLSTLHDIPVEKSWIHPVKMITYAPVGFNGDLTMYATYNYREEPNHVCRIYKVAEPNPELLETIPVGGTVNLDTLRFSNDNRYLTGQLWIDHKTWLWIYDRETKTSFQHEAQSYEYTPPVILNRSGKILFLTKDFRVLIVDIQSGQTVAEYELPNNFQKEALSFYVEVSADETRVALVADLDTTICLLNLSDATFEKIEAGEEQIFAIGWRPDGQQLAIGGDIRIRIWDIPRQTMCASFETECNHVTELLYSGNGRLLFTAGWDGTTRIYDPMAQDQVIRCEAFVKKVSADGTRFVTYTGQRYTIRKILSSPVIREYKYDTSSASHSVGIDACSATLWFSPEYTSSVVDFSGNRFLASKSGGALEQHFTVDPLGRDIFVSDGNNLKQYQIVLEHSDNEEDSFSQTKSIRIGPPRRLKWKSKTNVNNHHIGFDASGEKLSVNRDTKCQIVLSRETDWTAISHTHAEHPPIKVSIHPSLPLIATSVHHGGMVEVRDTEKNEIVFSLPTKQQEAHFTPDGKLLIVADEGNMTTYEVGTWKRVASLNDDVRIQTRFYAVSKDSRWIAAETSQPRGVTFLDPNTLRPVLTLNGNHTRPESYVHAIDSTGRFLSANRGRSIIGVWDLQELRQHFESLDLQWPLEGLGNPTPFREPSVPVDLVWESFDSDDLTGFEKWSDEWGAGKNIFQGERLQRFERSIGSSLNRIIGWLDNFLRASDRFPMEIRHERICRESATNMILQAFERGVPAYNSGDHCECSEVYMDLLVDLKTTGIINVEAEIMARAANSLDLAIAENDMDARAWILRHALDDLLAYLRSAPDND